ncbi:NDP-hexose 2,3-dehydratase family protein [Spirillospora sp. NPDC127200]
MSVELSLPRGSGLETAARVAASAAVTTSRTSPGTLDWLAGHQRRALPVERLPLAELDGWSFAPGSGNLRHRSGRFFTVEGLHAHTDHGPVPEWTQPIIVQRDIAILGILAKEIDGVLHFLLQAKMEPGNVNLVQLSPTVQATSSNYTRAHEGTLPPYLEYFLDPSRGRVLVDVLQSEQGSWFHHKRNRNVVIEVSEDVPEDDRFRWLPLGEIHRLLHRPNVINMDARTVLAGLPFLPPPGSGGPGGDGDGFGAALRRSLEPGGGPARHTMTEVVSWFTDRKCAYTMAARPIPLNAVEGWRVGGEEIVHDAGRHFRIVGVRVAASTREVSSWSQPLLAPGTGGLAAMVVRRFGGVLHALVRADVRPGNRDMLELGPTVQCALDERAEGRRLPFYDLAVSPPPGAVRYDMVQSEEGGRFLAAQNRYVVVEAGADFPAEVPPDYAWVTPGQLMELQRHSYHLNIECRTLLLCLTSLR